MHFSKQEKDIFANRMTDFERRALNFKRRRGEKECNQEHCGAVMDRAAEQESWGDVVGRDHKIIIMEFNWGYLQHLQISKQIPTGHHYREIPQVLSRKKT